MKLYRGTNFVVADPGFPVCVYRGDLVGGVNIVDLMQNISVTLSITIIPHFY